jgi:hypothetical protein
MQIRKNLLGIGALASLGLAALLLADDFTLPHHAEPGEVISADVLNEMFDEVRETQRSITSADLVGAWSGVQFSHTGPFENDTAGPDELYYSRPISVTFVDDGDGTFSWSSSPISPFIRQGDAEDTARTAGTFAVFHDKLYFHVSSAGTKGFAPLRRISPTRVLIECNFNGAANMSYVVLDKQHLPPAKPGSLSASASGLDVSLTWVDRSSDETGFRILRRDSVPGDYVPIATVAADSTAFTDTVPASGTYWYRVQAVNANGDSLGSNVALITVP